MTINGAKSAEADLVLSELNHRFLNSLQIMGSLTSIHSGRRPEKQLERLRDCISALGRVHRILSTPEVPSFSAGAEEICGALVEAVGRPATFSIIVVEEPAGSGLRRDLLLLLTELMTNALKHADRDPLIVSVELLRVAGDWDLGVTSSTRGRSGSPRIAGALARWLGGELSVDTGTGFAVSATLPDPTWLAEPSLQTARAG